MRFGKMVLIGAIAGAVNGLFGAGGGMLLIPLLTLTSVLEEDALFPACVCIMLPICVVSLVITGIRAPLPLSTALPYLLGSIPGGLAAGWLGKKIPTLWLHRGLGVMILWGGVRYLW